MSQRFVYLLQFPVNIYATRTEVDPVCLLGRILQKQRLYHGGIAVFVGFIDPTLIR